METVWKIFSVANGGGLYAPPVFSLCISLFVFLFGSCIGSFLNVCIWRIPRGESIVSPPSRCPKCGHWITALENIPIVSWLALRGKCSSCKEPISPRYIIIETLTGILYLLLFWNSFFGLQFFHPGYFVLLPLLICCAVNDCELGIIPNEYTCFGMGAGILCALLVPYGPLFSFLYSFFCVLTAGGVAALFAMLGKKLFKREALGWGDVKFLAMTGAFLGLPGVIFTVLAGSLAGLAAHPLVCLLKKRKSRTLRFGPYLAFGALLWMFAGDRLLRMYLELCATIAQK
ncbi:MAG: prepilin peptidase [Lentisphaeria bacterium]|nr:prepilin peptidase [Lentisphaeria bacterium]